MGDKMGFLDNYNDTESAGNTDKLDLVEFERNLIKKFNDEIPGGGIGNLLWQGEIRCISV